MDSLTGWIPDYAVWICICRVMTVTPGKWASTLNSEGIQTINFNTFGVIGEKFHKKNLI